MKKKKYSIPGNHNRIKWNAETGHEPCPICNGQVLRKDWQSEISWKRTEFCSDNCRRKRPHQTNPNNLKEIKVKQINPWPIIPKFTSIEPGDNLITRYDYSSNDVRIGTASQVCVDDMDAGRSV